MTACVQEEAFARAQFRGEWTRKGFQHTRWRFDGGRCDFELVNVHLIHDRCNIAALSGGEESPYAAERRGAMGAVLKRCALTHRASSRAIIFGDFNFRLGLRGAACAFLRCGQGDLRSTTSEGQDARGAPVRCIDLDAMGALGGDEDARIFVGPEEVSFSPSGAPFLQRWGDFRAADREVSKLALGLAEPAPITFAPTYRWDHARGAHAHALLSVRRCTEESPFSVKRCPAWTDRVLLTGSIAALLRGQAQLEYGAFSPSADTGDHKAVFLGCVL